jgi:hypothetical protein
MSGEKDRLTNIVGKLQFQLMQANIKVEEQKLTIKKLVSLCDELRQPYNNTVRHHYLYEKACDVLNELTDREMI